MRVSSEEASGQTSAPATVAQPSASLPRAGRKLRLTLPNPSLWFTTSAPVLRRSATHPVGEQHNTVGWARFSLLDRLFLKILAALGVVTLVALLLSPHFFMPAEDATILFQYSRNLAKTGAITYLEHGLHAEGATDFGWMVLIAIAIKVGVQAFWFVAFANVAALCAFSALLHKLADRRLRLTSFLAVIGLFALLPQFIAAMSGFSTLPFAFLLLVLLHALLREDDGQIALASLVLCLFRPDGVVFALPVLLTTLAVRPDRGRRLLIQAALFFVPGILYFLWRWHYFSEVVPLPFLVKADASRFYHLFVLSSLADAETLFLIALIFVALIFDQAGRSKTNWMIVVLFLIVPTAFYCAMRLDQDVGNRFFIYLPVGIAALIAVNWGNVSPKVLLHIGVLLWIAFFARATIWERNDFLFFQLDNRQAIAASLAKLPKGKMILTEAGVLPYFSEWTAYDAWGLNTAEFARRLFQPADVSRINPDLMLVYRGPGKACLSVDAGTPFTQRTWDHLTDNLVEGAKEARFELWLVPFGNSRMRAAQGLSSTDGVQECWFINPNSPLRQSIENVLANHGGTPVAKFPPGRLAAR